VKRSAVAAEAVSEIQALVRSGELRPGGRLPPERELARQLGVSRSTLREAIRALVAMNILVSRHGDGTYVSSLEPETLSRPFAFVLETRPALLEDLFEARRLLESACAELAAQRITDEEIAELERLAASGDGSVDDLIDRDVALHTAIVRATRNPILAGLAGSIGALGVDSRRDSARLPGQVRLTRTHHKRIVAALRRRAPAEAAAAMDAHLRSVERALVRSRRSA
jgi:GntR family transcriptional repressor for pyruvate dehydrogenase complex